MDEINVASENVRDKLPNPMAQVCKAKCKKLTKINIPHVAINYIRALENLLANSIRVFGAPQRILSHMLAAQTAHYCLSKKVFTQTNIPFE